jgi:hypothetical protein
MIMANVVKTIIAFRRAHTDEWLKYKDVVPAEGEPCFDLDLGTLKIGNGTDTYENLKPIGGVAVNIAADGKSVVLEDGVFKLAGFDATKVGAQPRVTADGTLEWVVPSTKDLEDLQTVVTGLQSSITTIQTEVTTIKEILTPSVEGAETLLSRVEGLEHQMDGTGEGTVDAKIEKKIKEFEQRVTDNETIDTIQELINYVANHGGELQGIVNDISDLQTKVGDDPVATQIANAIANIDYISGVKLGETPLDIVNRQVVIPVGAGLKASDEIDISEDGTISVKAITWDKIGTGESELILDGGGANRATI